MRDLVKDNFSNIEQSMEQVKFVKFLEQSRMDQVKFVEDSL